MSSVVKRNLNNGSQVPWIGFGTGEWHSRARRSASRLLTSSSPLAGTALYGKECADQVSTALSAGFVHLDAAQSYGNEDSVGEAVSKWLAAGHSREDLFITTKLQNLASAPTVRENLLVSLKKLQVDYVDLYLIHTPRPFEGKLRAIWKEMEAIQKEGLAKSIGVSNFRLKDFAEFIDEAEIVPACNQVSAPSLGVCRFREDLTSIPFTSDRVQSLPIQGYSASFGLPSSTQHPHGLLRWFGSA